MKLQILKENHAFSRAIQRGKRLSSTYLNLYAYRRRDRGPARFGVTTTRHYGKAHERNRVKRQLREICRALAPELKSAYDYVLMARPHAKGTNYHVLLDTARQLFEQANLFQET